MDPFSFKVSKSIGVSRSFAVRQPPEGPPVWTALKALPPLIPPPISYITSLRVVPIGISINPILFIFPARAKTFVPGEFFVPIFLNMPSSSFIINGILANVSTLFTFVGFPQ